MHIYGLQTNLQHNNIWNATRQQVQSWPYERCSQNVKKIVVWAQGQNILMVCFTISKVKVCKLESHQVPTKLVASLFAHLPTIEIYIHRFYKTMPIPNHFDPRFTYSHITLVIII
jgi:hypothetical protein